MSNLEKLERRLIDEYNALPEAASAEQADKLLEDICVVQVMLMAMSPEKS